MTRRLDSLYRARAALSKRDAVLDKKYKAHREVERLRKIAMQYEEELDEALKTCIKNGYSARYVSSFIGWSPAAVGHRLLRNRRGKK